MNGLPIIVSQHQDAEHSVLEILVEPGNPWFEGHFPQMAILPGVVQIGWAEHFACALYGFDAGVSTLEQVKFKRPILPGARLTLVLTPNLAARKLRYEYRDADTSYSAGTLNFGAKP